jgi:hypothetical protein
MPSKGPSILEYSVYRLDPRPSSQRHLHFPGDLARVIHNDLAAQQIAIQAFVVACMTRSKISQAGAARLVEDVVGYAARQGRPKPSETRLTRCLLSRASKPP